MTAFTAGGVRYPLLESLLAQKGLSLKGIYTVRDGAAIFGVANRTIQDWVREGKLLARDLPGRGRFLSEDLEDFLQKSVKKFHAPMGEAKTAKPEAFDQPRTSNRRPMGWPR